MAFCFAQLLLLHFLCGTVGRGAALSSSSSSSLLLLASGGPASVEVCQRREYNMYTVPATRTPSSTRATVVVTQYGAAFLTPSPAVTLVDFLGRGAGNGTTHVTASVAPHDTHCAGRVGYLSGATTVVVARGVATFDQINAYCYPGGNMTVQFTAQLARSTNTSFTLAATLTLVFRPCRDGELLLENVCVACPSGTFSFHFDAAATQCAPCPPFSDGCYGSAVDVSAGYWRPHRLSTVFLPCPYPSGCLGGVAIITTAAGAASNTTTTTTNATATGCAPGYNGPLCGVCSAGYFLDATLRECRSCAGQGAGQLATLIIVPIVLIVVAFFGFTKVAQVKEVIQSVITPRLGGTTPRRDRRAALVDVGKSRSAFLAAIAPDKKSFLQKNMTRAKKVLDAVSARLQRVSLEDVVPKIKLVVTSYQIISNFPQVLRLRYRGQSGTWMRALSFVNLSTIAGSPQCHTSFDYVDRLLMVTVTPLVIVALLGLVFLGHRTYLQRQGKEFLPIISQYVSMFLFITYLVLPGVTTTIFGALSCTGIDPEGLVPGSGTYLRNDLSVSCTSARYKFGVGWAAAMFLVYPVGVPTLYFYLLFIARDEIKEGKKERKLEIAKKKSSKESEEKEKEKGADKGNEIRRRSSLKRIRDAISARFYQRQQSIHNEPPGFGLGRAAAHEEVQKEGSHATAGSGSGVPYSAGHPGAPGGGASAFTLGAPPLGTHAGGPLARQSSAMLGPPGSRHGSVSTRLRGSITAASARIRGSIRGSVAVPALNFSALKRSSISNSVRNFQHNLVVRLEEVAQKAASNGIMKYIVTELQFLHHDYRASYWFYEIVLTIRKLLLTAGMSVVLPGTSDQIVVAIVICMVFWRFENATMPYFDRNNDDLAEIANDQVFVILFVSLLVRADAVTGPVWAIAMEAIIILAILATPVAAVAYSFRESVVSYDDEHKGRKSSVVGVPLNASLKAANANANAAAAAIAIAAAHAPAPTAAPSPTVRTSTAATTATTRSVAKTVRTTLASWSRKNHQGKVVAVDLEAGSGGGLRSSVGMDSSLQSIGEADEDADDASDEATAAGQRAFMASLSARLEAEDEGSDDDGGSGGSDSQSSVAGGSGAVAVLPRGGLRKAAKGSDKRRSVAALAPAAAEDGKDTHVDGGRDGVLLVEEFVEVAVGAETPPRKASVRPTVPHLALSPTDK